MHIDTSSFDQLHHQGIGVVNTVSGEFTHLIDSFITDNLILEGNGQHLVGTKGLTEGDEAELLIVGVFATGEQAGTFYLLVIATRCETETLHV